MSCSPNTPRIIGLLVFFAITTLVARPGYAVLNQLQSCVLECKLTTDPGTMTRLLCVGGCYGSYGASILQLRGPAGLTLAGPWGQGEGVTCSPDLGQAPPSPEYPTCLSAGVPAFTVNILRVAGTPEPLHVDVLALSDATPGFLLVGQADPVAAPQPHYEWSAPNLTDTFYLFVARYTDDPAEESEDAAAFFASPTAIDPPVAVNQLTWTGIKSRFW